MYESNALGLWLGSDTASIDLTDLVQEGLNFIVADMHNDTWADIVQDAHNAGVPDIIGVTTLNPLQLRDANPAHSYWEIGQLEADPNMKNNPAWSFISGTGGCASKDMQGLIVRIRHPMSADQGHDTWIANIYQSMIKYIRNHIKQVNPNIKYVIPMVDKNYIDTYSPALGQYLYSKVVVKEKEQWAEEFCVANQSVMGYSLEQVSGIAQIKSRQPVAKVKIQIPTDRWMFWRWANENFRYSKILNKSGKMSKLGAVFYCNDPATLYSNFGTTEHAFISQPEEPAPTNLEASLRSLLTQLELAKANLVMILNDLK
jgi:hypothetical protein